MRRFVSIAILTCVASAASLEGADRGRIRTLNVTLQPALTALSAAIRGNLRTKKDWFRCLTSGAAAGTIFYDAKVRASRGSIPLAWLEANVAASFSANAAARRNPFSRLRLTVGPLRADVSTPFDSERNAAVHFSASIAEAGAMVWMQHRSTRMVFRDGLIAFRSNRRYCDGDRCFPGYTIGSFSGTVNHATPDTWPHEVIHSIQAIQADSVEPPPCAYLRRCSDPPKQWRPVRWDGFDAGALLVIGGLATRQQPYERRWTEIEAWRLAEDSPPQ